MIATLTLVAGLLLAADPAEPSSNPADATSGFASEARSEAQPSGDRRPDSLRPVPGETGGKPIIIPVGAPEAKAEVHGHSRTFVFVGARPYYELSADTGALVERREVPVVQDFFLDAKTGVDGLSIALDAWIALDVGQQVLSQRAIADITEGYLEWKQRTFTVRAGRVFVQSPAARRDRMDGGWVRIHPRDTILDAKLTLDLYGGLPVTPLYGDEVLRSSGSPTLAHDPLVLAAGGSDWSRPGDWVAGAMFDARWKRVDVGVGFVRQNDLAIVDREAAVGRVEITPIDRITFIGYGSYDTYGKGIEDARLSLAAWILPSRLRVGAYARMTNPSLLLPASSIFSVFANETHREVGLEADLWLARRYRISGAAELRQTQATTKLDSEDEVGTGHRLSLSLRGPITERTRGILSYERLSDGWFGGYDYGRAGVEAPLVGWLSMSADGGLFLIHADGKDDRTALRGSIAAIAQHLRDWRIALALRATRSPDVPMDVALIARIEWNAERTF